MQKEMTVTRGLAELKLLNKRIEKAILDVNYAVALSGKKVPRGFSSIDEYKKENKEKHQSVNDLIENRNKIKKAIVKSNAETVLNIAGKEMTVAEAIDRKTAIAFEKELLFKMKHDLREAYNQYDFYEDDYQKRLDKQLEIVLGKDAKNSSSEEYESVEKQFEKMNKPHIVSPFEISKEIEKLSKEIEDFESEVDLCLSESNAKTHLKI